MREAFRVRRAAAAADGCQRREPRRPGPVRTVEHDGQLFDVVFDGTDGS